MKAISLILMALSLNACAFLGFNSLEPKNLVKTGSTTAVTYAIAGPVPAAANLITSVVVDEAMPEDNKVSDIEEGNWQQMFAYMWTDLKELVLYGAIAFFMLTTVVAPWAAQRRAHRRAKYEGYKAEAKAARAVNQELAKKTAEK